MAVVVARDALEKAGIAVYNAIRQCRDLDGEEIKQPQLSDDDLVFAVLGTMTMLVHDEVLQEVLVPQEWPKCRANRE